MFSTLFRDQADSLILAWTDAVYADRRTDLPVILSYRELVEHVPELLEELAAVLDGASDYEEIVEATRRLRFHAQARFQQGTRLGTRRVFRGPALGGVFAHDAVE